MRTRRTRRPIVSWTRFPNKKARRLVAAVRSRLASAAALGAKRKLKQPPQAWGMRAAILSGGSRVFRPPPPLPPFSPSPFVIIPSFHSPLRPVTRCYSRRTFLLSARLGNRAPAGASSWQGGAFVWTAIFRLARTSAILALHPR